MRAVLITRERFHIIEICTGRERSFRSNLHLRKIRKTCRGTHMHQIVCWVGVMNQGCRFVPEKHLGKQTLRHRWYLPLDLNIGVFFHQGLVVIHGHIYPVKPLELMISLAFPRELGFGEVEPPSGCFIGWIYPQPSSSGK